MRAIIVVTALLGVAHAQIALPSAPLGHFVSGNTEISLSVSDANARIALPSSGMKDGGAVLVWNTGNSLAQIAFGDENVTAPDSMKLSVEPGCFRAFAQGNASYLAAVTQQGTTSLSLFGGHGLPAKGCVSQPSK